MDRARGLHFLVWRFGFLASTNSLLNCCRCGSYFLLNRSFQNPRDVISVNCKRSMESGVS